MDEKSFESPIQPVALLILDICMPILDGMETVKRVKEKFRQFNEEICKKLVLKLPSASKKNQIVIRPLIIHLSQFDDNFQSFIKEEERADLYISKPVKKQELVSVLKLLRLF